ncbi:MAG: response regulator [Candidatus Gracilibacteria bacterium]|nr:response regulator [Candidatus Gracilibacteria bacterium]
MIRKETILIIEDTVDLVELYKIYFEGEGLEVYTATDGLEGITKMVEIKPDIVLLDIMMPQMNGFEVLEAIKNQTSMDTPIIICSNLSKQTDIDKALELGADLYIRKSDYEGSEIVKKVMEFVKSNNIIS